MYAIFYKYMLFYRVDQLFAILTSCSVLNTISSVWHAGIKGFIPINSVSSQISSDGTKLVYLSRIDRKLQVVLEDLEKKTRQYLGNGNFDDTPRISPDDTMIMYATAIRSGLGSMLMLTSINGTVRTPVMASGASLKHPSWSPVSQVK